MTTSGSSIMRAESRLLDSAVRDAVGQAGVSSTSGNPSRRTESGVKRLRSVVVGGTDNPDLPPEANGRDNHLKPRLDMGLQGSKVPPGVAVALKAAAAAAEDVNNNSRKNRMRSSVPSGSVWDRLGNKSSERLGIKETESQEAAGVNADNGDGEDMWEDTINGGGQGAPVTKRPRWRKVSDRLGPKEEEDTAMAPDVSPGGFGYVQGKRAVETKWYDPVGRGMNMSAEEISDEDDRFGDAVNYADGGFFRYGTMNDPREDISGRFHESGSLFYRLGERAPHGLPHGLIGLSGAVNLPNKGPNIHINSNARYLLSKDADMALNDPRDLYFSNHGAPLQNPSGPRLAVVDANDVSEMKKRMRQVQLEMTKLRAKQAEVSKEAQKVTSAPVAMKARSQEEIDLHSVCVTNIEVFLDQAMGYMKSKSVVEWVFVDHPVKMIHFAATKEMIAAHFSNCGDIVRVTILMDPATGKPRGSAYVEFSLKDSVEKALNMSDSSLLSRSLKVVPKDAAAESIFPQTAGRPNHVPSYASMRAPGKFMRGRPLSMRRSSSMARPFAGTAHLQWKRETSSPVGKVVSPNFGHTNGSSSPSTGRITALQNPSSMMGDRYGMGPIRMTRSMSYVRPAPYPTRETSQTSQTTLP